MGVLLSKEDLTKKDNCNNVAQSVREKSGLRQIDLAKELGVSQSTVSRHERNRPVDLINRKLKVDSDARRKGSK